MHISLPFATPTTINTASFSSFYIRGLILQFIVTYPVEFLFYNGNSCACKCLQLRNSVAIRTPVFVPISLRRDHRCDDLHADYVLTNHLIFIILVW